MAKHEINHNQQTVYDKDFPLVQINGYVKGPFPIHCSVRQGCPKSVLLFEFVLNPLICLLERNLMAIRIGHRTTNTAVVAHGDNITIFVTAPADMQIMRDFLLAYERATGACLNIRKSKAIAAGSCDTSINVMDIPHYQKITIL